MNFALLGVDAFTLQIVRFLVAQPQHELFAAVVLPEDVARILPLAPRAVTHWSWEDLIAASEIHAILVSRSAEQELLDEQLRKLAQAATPLLVSHPLCSSIVGYEIDMIQRDTDAVVLPVFPGRGHPCLQLMREWSSAPAECPVGRIEQVDLQRQLDCHDRDSVTRALTLDLHVLNALLGGVTSVSAAGSQGPAETLEHLTVHMTGTQTISARWSSIPHGEPGARMNVFGSSGIATIRLSADAIPCRIEAESWVEKVVSFDQWDAAAATIADLERALAQQPYGTTWGEVCRDLDVAETAELSLRRRRTLDVFSEPPTEESSFKGLMAAGSCGLLLVLLAAFVILAVVEGLRLPLPEVPSRWRLLVRLWPVYPLLAFLALQFLLIVARKPSRRPPVQAGREEEQTS